MGKGALWKKGRGGHAGVEWEVPGEVRQEKGLPPAAFPGSLLNDKRLPEILQAYG